MMDLVHVPCMCGGGCPPCAAEWGHFLFSRRHESCSGQHPSPSHRACQVYTSGLTAAAGKTIVLTYPAPIQQGAPLSGTYRLNVGGSWTAPIPFDASADVFEAAVTAANPAYVINVEDQNWDPLSGIR